MTVDRPVCVCHGEPMHKSGTKNGKVKWKCPEQNRLNAKRYHAANRDKERARMAAYRAANPEKVGAAYYAANRDKELARGSAFREANREKLRVQAAAYRAANPEKVRASRMTWLAANREKERARVAAWRQKQRRKGNLP